ncbi:MAG: 3-deoxy-manno-octulosonate cytidylyltransferase [Bacteroidota bacterium]
MNIIAIIPARYHSSRLPGKLLEEVGGKSILQRVYDQAVSSQLFSKVIIATDHHRIADHCLSLQMVYEWTSESHHSGTDRIAEVAEKLKADIIINIQGDEPFIEQDCLQKLVQQFNHDHVQIATLCKKIEDADMLFDYNVVKLVKSKKDKVLYFSRQTIPAHRDLPYKNWFENHSYYQHLGLYGFRRNVLLELVKLPISTLEATEKLEQLRWLENGYDIYCKIVLSNSFGIDTREDLNKARALYK